MDEGGSLFLGGQTIEELEQGDAVRLTAGRLFCFAASIADFFPFNHDRAIILLSKRQHIVKRKACAPAHFIGDGDPAALPKHTIQLIIFLILSG